MSPTYTVLVKGFYHKPSCMYSPLLLQYKCDHPHAADEFSEIYVVKKKKIKNNSQQTQDLNVEGVHRQLKVGNEKPKILLYLNACSWDTNATDYETWKIPGTRVLFLYANEYKKRSHKKKLAGK